MSTEIFTSQTSLMEKNNGSISISNPPTPDRSYSSTPEQLSSAPSTPTLKARPVFPNVIYNMDGSPLNRDLDYGYRMLRDLVSKKHKSMCASFLDPLDRKEFPHLSEVNHQPNFLNQILDKFLLHQYANLTEVIADLRQMWTDVITALDADGDHPLIKKVQLMETIIKQKITTWPKDVQAYTTISVTHPDLVPATSAGTGRPSRHTNPSQSFVSLMLSKVKSEEMTRKKEREKREKEELATELKEWAANLLDDKSSEIIYSSWELPHIGLFFYLCKDPLNVAEISQFELEMSFLLPFNSFTMNNMMTALLSTPFQRQRSTFSPLNPNVWHRKLTARLDAWYKKLAENGGDFEITAYQLGIDESFFDIVGRLRNPLTEKLYDDLTLYQRIWIIKSLCEYCMHTQACLREHVDTHPSDDAREYLLGSDRQGNLYINFPQFCGTCLRVYKQFKNVKKLLKESIAGEETPVEDIISVGTPTPGTPLKCDTPDPDGDCGETGLSARALRQARRNEIAHYNLLDTPQQIQSNRRKRTRNEQLDENAKKKPSDNTNDSSLDSCDLKEMGEPKIENLLKQESTEPDLTANTSWTLANSSGALITKTDDKAERINELADVKYEPADLSQPENLSSIQSEPVDPPQSGTVLEPPQPEVREEEKDLLSEPEDVGFRLIIQTVEDLRLVCEEFEDSTNRKEGDLYASLSKLYSDLAPFDARLHRYRQTDLRSMKDFSQRSEMKVVLGTNQQPGQIDSGFDSTDEEKVEASSEELTDSDNQSTSNCELTKDDSNYTLRDERVKQPRKQKQVITTNGEEELPEFGVSTFGRIRKRRLIPNNSEEHVFISSKRSKKKEPPESQPVDAQKTSKVVPKPAEVTPVKSAARSLTAPPGYSIVKIHKEFYLIPTSQLPHLVAKQSKGLSILSPTTTKNSLSSLPQLTIANLSASNFPASSTIVNLSDTPVTATVPSVNGVNTGNSAVPPLTTQSPNTLPVDTKVVTHTLQEQGFNKPGSFNPMLSSLIAGPIRTHSTRHLTPRVTPQHVTICSVNTATNTSFMTSVVGDIQIGPQSPQPIYLPAAGLVTQVSSPTLSNRLQSPEVRSQSLINIPTSLASKIIKTSTQQIGQPRIAGIPANILQQLGGKIQIVNHTSKSTTSPMRTIVLPSNIRAQGLANSNVTIIPPNQHVTPVMTKSLAAKAISFSTSNTRSPASSSSVMTLHPQLPGSANQVVSQTSAPTNPNTSPIQIAEPGYRVTTSGVRIITPSNRVISPPSQIIRPVSVNQFPANLVQKVPIHVQKGSASEQLIRLMSLPKSLQTNLDEAVKAVVTEPIKTTLPSAAIKMTSGPNILQSSVRRPQTIMTQAMKSPIAAPAPSAVRLNNSSVPNTEGAQTQPSIHSPTVLSTEDPHKKFIRLSKVTEVIGSSTVTIPASSFVTSQPKPRLVIQAPIVGGAPTVVPLRANQIRSTIRVINPASIKNHTVAVGAIQAVRPGAAVTSLLGLTPTIVSASQSGLVAKPSPMIVMRPSASSQNVVRPGISVQNFNPLILCNVNGKLYVRQPSTQTLSAMQVKKSGAGLVLTNTSKPGQIMNAVGPGAANIVNVASNPSTASIGPVMACRPEVVVVRPNSP